MSKGSMLKLFELNGRGQSMTAVALPGQPHSQSGRLLLWTIQSNRPVQEPRPEGLVKLIGGPRPGPLGHPAALSGAQKHGTPAAGKQAGYTDMQARGRLNAAGNRST
jgi:hypothetical protein